MQSAIRRNNAMAPLRNTATAFTSANQTLAIGQMAYETDTGKWKRGDGKTSWTALGHLN